MSDTTPNTGNYYESLEAMAVATALSTASGSGEGKKMSDTPRTDEVETNEGWTATVPAEFARQLERELIAMTNYAERARARELEQLDELAACYRLEKALDEMIRKQSVKGVEP